MFLSIAWPRRNSVLRATSSSAKLPSICFRRRQPEMVTADDDQLQSADSFFRDEHPWRSQAMGRRYHPSKRIGIRDPAGAPRYIINVVDDVTERRRADEKIAPLAHYAALTDLPNRVLFREQIERELKQAAHGTA